MQTLEYLEQPGKVQWSVNSSQKHYYLLSVSNFITFRHHWKYYWWLILMAMMITLAISLIKIMKYCCTVLGCCPGRIMYKQLKEVISSESASHFKCGMASESKRHCVLFHHYSCSISCLCSTNNCWSRQCGEDTAVIASYILIIES